jgi:hypothetical protein
VTFSLSARRLSGGDSDHDECCHENGPAQELLMAWPWLCDSLAGRSRTRSRRPWPHHGQTGSGSAAMAGSTSACALAHSSCEAP